MGLFNKQFNTGREVTITGHIAGVRTAYRTKDGAVNCSSVLSCVSRASLLAGGLGRMPQSEAKSETLSGMTVTLTRLQLSKIVISKNSRSDTHCPLSEGLFFRFTTLAIYHYANARLSPVTNPLFNLSLICLLKCPDDCLMFFLDKLVVTLLALYDWFQVIRR